MLSTFGSKLTETRPVALSMMSKGRSSSLDIELLMESNHSMCEFVMKECRAAMVTSYAAWSSAFSGTTGSMWTTFCKQLKGQVSVKY